MINKLGQYRAGDRLYALYEYFDTMTGTSRFVIPYHRSKDIDDVTYWAKGESINDSDMVWLVNYLITTEKGQPTDDK